MENTIYSQYRQFTEESFFDSYSTTSYLISTTFVKCPQSVPMHVCQICCKYLILFWSLDTSVYERIKMIHGWQWFKNFICLFIFVSSYLNCDIWALLFSYWSMLSNFTKFGLMVSKIIASFLSAKWQWYTNYKEKPGIFGIVGLGKDSGFQRTNGWVRL